MPTSSYEYQLAPMHSPKPTIQALLQPASPFMTEMNEEEEENALATFQQLQYALEYY